MGPENCRVCIVWTKLSRFSLLSLRVYSYPPPLQHTHNLNLPSGVSENLTLIIVFDVSCTFIFLKIAAFHPCEFGSQSGVVEFNIATWGANTFKAIWLCNFAADVLFNHTNAPCRAYWQREFLQVITCWNARRPYRRRVRRCVCCCPDRLRQVWKLCLLLG